MFIRKKTFILIITYLTAAVLALGAYAYALSWGGTGYRYAARYGYEHAFSEVVSASEKLCEALHRGEYTTGAALSNEVCADVYASCLAAGMTMSALPFSTQELEQTASFIGIAGDYAQSLMRDLAAEGFDAAARKNFAALYRTAEKINDGLRALQEDVINGDVLFDEPENKFAAKGTDGLLSTALKKLEGDMDEPPELDYDGRYTRLSAKVSDEPVSESEAKKKAAGFLGAEERELERVYRTSSGSTCFASGDRSIIVDSFGNVISVSSDRAVTGDMSNEELEKKARKFLKDKGFNELSLRESERYGDVLSLEFECISSGVRCETDSVKISMAADNGELYAFAAKSSGKAHSVPSGTVSESEAKNALPEGVSAKCEGLVWAETAGGGERLCYDLSCKSGDDTMHIYVDALTGEQYRISFF